MQQISFEQTKTPWRHRWSYGGTLRQKRNGRGARPLSTKDPLHLVLKARRQKIRYGFRTPKRFLLIHQILEKYSRKFFVKVEQVSVQSDHLHLLVRTTRRSNYQSFFRVLAGQIAQRFEKEGLLSVDSPVTGTRPRSQPRSRAVDRGLWRHRPFTRIVRGLKGLQIVRNYIQLNEKEARNEIPYRKERLKGLSNAEWRTQGDRYPQGLEDGKIVVLIRPQNPKGTP